MLNIVDVKCEYRRNPIGIDVKQPRFSWKLESDNRNVMQVSYHIQVTEEGALRPIWDKEERTCVALHIVYEGPALESNKRYTINVKVMDNNGEIGSSCGENFFETGLMDIHLWQGQWIGKKKTTPREEMDCCPILRKEVKLEKKIKRARAYVSAMGLYEVYSNGSLVGDYVLAPGWTSYNNRIQYQCYDMTALLKEGVNTLGLRLGDGWHNGEMSFNHKIHTYGEHVGALFQLIVTYEDESEQIIVSDGTWKTSDSGVIYSEIYNGEIYDANLEPVGWSETGFDDRIWEAVVVIDRTKENLVATANEGTKRIEEIEPIEILKTPAGETLIDMGQNMSGWLKVTVSGQKGDLVHLKHAEVLDEEGNFYFDNIRLAKQETSYTLSGKDKEVFEPHFTFQGFRYVKVLAFPGEPTLEHFTGVVIHTAMEETVAFKCSDPLINQLHHNIMWGQKGNFIDVPTDCPQRDERLGWTGDAQIFCRTACFNFGADAFFSKWLADVRADQFENGAVPFVVPNVLPQDWSFLTEGQLGYDQTSAAWGDAITICAWALYQCYGDQRILEVSYEAMKKYVGYIHDGGENPYIWDWGPQLGDWLALDNKEGSYRGGTEESFTATAYYAHSVKIVKNAAKILGLTEDVQKYAKLLENITKAFKGKYMKDGRILQETQTAQILPLEFGLLEGIEITYAVEKLIELLQKKGYHLTTGFMGTPYLCHVLSRNGHSDIAYKVLMQQDFPSWLYQVSKGATTIWEHWDGKKPDGSFWSPNMNSFNHYAYGAIGDWLYRVVAGIEIDEEKPAYKHVIIKPHPNGCINDVTCQYQSIHGEISSAWSCKEEGSLEMQVTIPANTTGTIYVPISEGTSVREKGIDVKEVSGITLHEVANGYCVLRVGSGAYHFIVK